MSVTSGTRAESERTTTDRITTRMRRTAESLGATYREAKTAPRAALQRQLLRSRWELSQADGTAETVLRAGQSGGRLVAVMLTITIAAAVGFVGTKVISELDSSIQTTQGTKFDNASDSIAQGFADAMGLTDVVFLVLIAGVVLGALLGFQARR